MMKSIQAHYVMCFFLCGISYATMSVSKAIRKPAITFHRNGGRFGDDLLSYAQAWWLAYKYDLDFFLTPFTYSEMLELHYKHPHINSDIVSKYKHTYVINRGRNFPLPVDEKGFYYSTYYCNSGINWSDETFRDAMKQYIAPHGEWHYMELPNTMRTVAIHVRRGGGYRIDSDFCRRRRPYHFPSVEYYGNSLQLLLDRYPNENFFVHIFTDDRDPAGVAQSIKQCINLSDESRVEFSWRMKGNNYATNVVEDFFDMTRFMYLIRPNSNMSIFAERIGDHDIVIVPRQASSGRPWGRVSVIELRVRTPNCIEREQASISYFSGRVDSQKTTDVDQQNPVPHKQSWHYRPRRKLARRSAVVRKLLRRRLQLKQAAQSSE